MSGELNWFMQKEAERMDALADVLWRSGVEDEEGIAEFTNEQAVERCRKAAKALKGEE